MWDYDDVPDQPQWDHAAERESDPSNPEDQYPECDEVSQDEDCEWIESWQDLKDRERRQAEEDRECERDRRWRLSHGQEPY